MAELVESSAEYNPRAMIIQALRAGRSLGEIIRFFGYPRSTVCDITQQYADSQKSEEDFANPVRQSSEREDCKYPGYHPKSSIVYLERLRRLTSEIVHHIWGDIWNPLDYYVWGVIEKVFKVPKFRKLQAAIEAVILAVQKMDRGNDRSKQEFYWIIGLSIYPLSDVQTCFCKFYWINKCFIKLFVLSGYI